MTKQQFIELAATEQEALRRFLRGLCGGDGFRADDIAQEALLKAYLSFERFQGRSRFSTWLFRIAYNCWYDQLQNYPDNESVDLQEVRKFEDEGSPADKKYEYQQLYAAFGILTRQEQTVILLFYMEEKSVKEIEVITGMPSGTIRSHLSRARGHLKQYLERL